MSLVTALSLCRLSTAESSAPAISAFPAQYVVGPNCFLNLFCTMGKDVSVEIHYGG